MRILILGGTAWLGGQLASSALTAGHDVTCLARGSSGVAPGGATYVKADRDEPDGHQAVAEGPWDLVIDVARQPGQVRRAVAALASTSERYAFVSTGNVYADHQTRGLDESAELLPALDGDVMESPETYGEAKVACEQHVVAGFGPERSLLVRAGLIGGPGDVSDRSGYWPLRFARPATDDGSVLVPDVDELIQLIDVRDLAEWILGAALDGAHGAFNATGEPGTLRDHLHTARTVAGHTGELVAVDGDWLVAHEVEPWMGPRSLPLWTGDPEWAGFNARDSSRAAAAGLQRRPLAQTLADTLAWELTRDSAAPRRAGLTDADERELVAAARG